MKTKLFAVTLALIAGVYGCKKDNYKQVLTDNQLITNDDKAVDDVVRPYAKRKEVIGLSIGVLQNGKQQFYNYGEKVKGGGQLPDSRTAFEIGSVSKTFTALMLVQLLQNKHLSIDTKISELLPKDIPSLQYNGKYVTVKNLLNHTSGLPRLPDDFAAGSNALQPYAHYDSLKVYNYLKTHALNKEPGVAFEYSNLGMGLAGLIIERLSGKSYADYLRDNINEVLKFENTAANIARVAGVALPYDKNGQRVDYWSAMGGFKGAGAIYSCTYDLLKYAYSEMHPDEFSIGDNLFKTQQPTFSDGTYKLGLGWFFLTISGRECLVHDGGTGGFRSFIYISRSTNTALVILSNNGSDDVAVMANALSQQIIK